MNKTLYTPELGDSLFHFFLLDDELNKGGVSYASFEDTLRQHVLRETDLDEPKALPVRLMGTDTPEQLLVEVGKVIGKRPFAAVIDFNLLEAVGSKYMHGAGGFQVWAAIVRQTSHLPPHLTPLTIIYTAKEEITRIFEVIQPAQVGDWIWDKMNPVVLTFKSPRMDNPGPLMQRLRDWLRQTRTRFLRQWGDADIKDLRDRVSQPADRADPLTAWGKKRSFPIPDTAETWRGSLATLFPDFYNRLESEDPLRVCDDVARALGLSIPDCTRLLGRLMAEDTKDLKKDPRFRALKTLPENLTKFDHISRQPKKYATDPIPPVRELIKALSQDFTETGTACGWHRQADADSPHAIPNGLASFLHRFDNLEVGALDQLDKVINGPEEGDKAREDYQLGWARWHLAGIVPTGQVPAGLWFLDTDETSRRTPPATPERATKLLEQFITALGLVTPPVRRRFPDDPWREFLWYFPFPAEVGWGIRRVIDLNRKRYGKGVPEEWYTAVQPRRGARGALTLQILAKTQDTNDPAIDHERVAAAPQSAEPHPEKLSGLHAIVCGQYGGIIRLLQGGGEIQIRHRRVTPPGSGLQKHAILSALGERYDPGVPSVVGAWYLIEIESREMDE